MSWREPGEGFFLPDPSDPPEIRCKFGYEHMVLVRRARQWYRAAGVTDERELRRLADQVYMDFCATRPDLREVCRRRNVRSAAEAENEWRSGLLSRDLGLTKPEIEFLVDHFDGANDPVAAAILKKAIRALQ